MKLNNSATKLALVISIICKMVKEEAIMVMLPY
jgi:hypothetical protein